MKKDLKEKLLNEIKELINKCDLRVLIFNHEANKKELNDLDNKIEVLSSIKYEKIRNLEINEDRLQKIRDIQAFYNKDIDEIYSKKKVCEAKNKAYNLIISNGLQVICNELINMIINNCKNKRDLNEFINFFKYNQELKEYPLGYSFYYSEYYNYFNLGRAGYKINMYCKMDFSDNKMTPSQYFNYEANKERINYYNIYFEPLKKGTIFDDSVIEKNIINLLQVSSDEQLKQHNFIIESNKKIDNANTYKLDGFKAYNIL